jgi:hypothetical protein
MSPLQPFTFGWVLRVFFKKNYPVVTCVAVVSASSASLMVDGGRYEHAAA